MIDVSKIRVGDEVTVRARVDRTDAGVGRPIQISFGGRVVCISDESIATHTPAPRQFKPGDKVKVGTSGPLTIIAIEAEDAWVRAANGDRFTTTLHALRHADESE
jgi:hypothetical protein